MGEQTGPTQYIKNSIIKSTSSLLIIGQCAYLNRKNTTIFWLYFLYHAKPADSVTFLYTLIAIPVQRSDICRRGRDWAVWRDRRWRCALRRTAVAGRRRSSRRCLTPWTGHCRSAAGPSCDAVPTRRTTRPHASSRSLKSNTTIAILQRWIMTTTQDRVTKDRRTLPPASERSNFLCGVLLWCYVFKLLFHAVNGTVTKSCSTGFVITAHAQKQLCQYPVKIRTASLNSTTLFSHNNRGPFQLLEDLCRCSPVWSPKNLPNLYLWCPQVPQL